MRRISASIVLATLLTAPSCSPSGDGPPPFTERDSSGVYIVEGRFAAIPTGYTVGREPRWTLGGIDAPEDEQLFQVSGARLLPDGRVVLANAGSGEIRVYATDRTRLSTHGRKGDGPGEFQSPTLLDVRADSAFVFDQQHRRLSVVHLADGFARSTEVTWTGAGFPVPRGMLADGSIAVGGGMSFSSEDGFPNGVIRPLSTFGWIGPEGSSETHVADLPASEMFARADDRGFMARSLPFGRVTNVVGADDGLWIGTADSYEVRFYDSSGALVRLVRVDAPARAVTAGMLSDLVEETIEDQGSSGTQAEEIRQLFREMPAADVLPPYERLFVDRLGYLWVQDYLVPGDDVPAWTVFDPEGRPVSRVTTPVRTRLLDVGEDYLLGRTLDELDVESLTLWALERG